MIMAKSDHGHQVLAYIRASWPCYTICGGCLERVACVGGYRFSAAIPQELTFFLISWVKN